MGTVYNMNGGGGFDFAHLNFVNSVIASNYSSPTISYTANKIGNLIIIHGASISTFDSSLFSITGIKELFRNVQNKVTVNRSDQTRGVFIIIGKAISNNITVKYNGSDGNKTYTIEEYN